MPHLLLPDRLGLKEILDLLDLLVLLALLLPRALQARQGRLVLRVLTRLLPGRLARQGRLVLPEIPGQLERTQRLLDLPDQLALLGLRAIRQLLLVRLGQRDRPGLRETLQR